MRSMVEGYARVILPSRHRDHSPVPLHQLRRSPSPFRGGLASRQLGNLLAAPQAYALFRKNCRASENCAGSELAREAYVSPPPSECPVRITLPGVCAVASLPVTAL